MSRIKNTRGFQNAKSITKTDPESKSIERRKETTTLLLSYFCDYLKRMREIEKERVETRERRNKKKQVSFFL